MNHVLNINRQARGGTLEKNTALSTNGTTFTILYYSI